MKSKEKIAEFFPEVYPRRLWVAYGSSIKDINDRFLGRDHEPISFNANALDAMTITVIEKSTLRYGVLVVFGTKEDATPPTITHESIHVAMSIFEDIGAEFTFNNQEPFAYLVEWVSKCCHEFVHKDGGEK